MADLDILNSDLQKIYKEGSNDSEVMADLMSKAIHKYCMSLRVKKGIKTKGSGTGNMGAPVSVEGTTISVGELE